MKFELIEHAKYIWRTHPRLIKWRIDRALKKMADLDKHTNALHHELYAKLNSNLQQRAEAGLPMPQVENRNAPSPTGRYSQSRYARFD